MYTSIISVRLILHAISSIPEHNFLQIRIKLQHSRPSAVEDAPLYVQVGLLVDLPDTRHLVDVQGAGVQSHLGVGYEVCVEVEDWVDIIKKIFISTLVEITFHNFIKDI